MERFSISSVRLICLICFKILVMLGLFYYGLNSGYRSGLHEGKIVILEQIAATGEAKYDRYEITSEGFEYSELKSVCGNCHINKTEGR